MLQKQLDNLAARALIPAATQAILAPLAASLADAGVAPAKSPAAKRVRDSFLGNLIKLIQSPSEGLRANHRDSIDGIFLALDEHPLVEVVLEKTPAKSSAKKTPKSSVKKMPEMASPKVQVVPKDTPAEMLAAIRAHGRTQSSRAKKLTTPVRDGIRAAAQAKGTTPKAVTPKQSTPLRHGGSTPKTAKASPAPSTVLAAVTALVQLEAAEEVTADAVAEAEELRESIFASIIEEWGEWEEPELEQPAKKARTTPKAATPKATTPKSSRKAAKAAGVEEVQEEVVMAPKTPTAFQRLDAGHVSIKKQQRRTPKKTAVRSSRKSKFAVTPKVTPKATPKAMTPKAAPKAATPKVALY
jgi:hypothetical protein